MSNKFKLKRRIGKMRLIRVYKFGVEGEIKIKDYSKSH